MTFSSNPRSEKKRAFPVALEGLPLVAASAFVTAYLAIVGLSMVALFFLAVTLFIGFFFRDPERVIPEETGTTVVSAADGRVVDVKIVQGSDVAGEAMLKISVFMSVFNVHVNRIPVAGTIKKIVYQPGKFFSANLDKASQHNESNRITLETRDSKSVAFIQISGLIARRIACWVKEADDVEAGQRFGLIRFGSRVEIYLPEDTIITVQNGQKVKAGMTIIGHLS